MIDRQHNRIMLECDSCPEIFEGKDGEEWGELWSRAKSEGWKTRKIGHDWVHGCQNCGV